MYLTATELNSESDWNLPPEVTVEWGRKSTMFSYPCICFFEFFQHKNDRVPEQLRTTYLYFDGLPIKMKTVRVMQECQRPINSMPSENSCRWYTKHMKNRCAHITQHIFKEPVSNQLGGWDHCLFFPSFSFPHIFNSSSSGSTPCSDTRHQQVVGLLHFCFPGSLWQD